MTMTMMMLLSYEYYVSNFLGQKATVYIQEGN